MGFAYRRPLAGTDSDRYDASVMAHESILHESIFLSASDGYEIHARWWPGGSRGAVLYLHGIQSHGLWFASSADRLAERGFSVLLPDRRGSGRNERSIRWRGLKRRLIADVAEHAEWLCRQLHVETVHLVGVSWGGKLATAAYHRHETKIASLTLIAPGLIQRVDVSRCLKARIAVAAVFSPGTRFEIPLSDAELFTGNPEKLRFIREDGDRLQRTGAGFLAASRLMDSAKTRLAAARPCPLHVFLAEHDEIIDTDRTRTWVRDLGWPNARVTIYENAHHTLEFEPDPEPYFRDLADWLESVTS